MDSMIKKDLGELVPSRRGQVNGPGAGLKRAGKKVCGGATANLHD
jgi:hypothetical protein